MVEKYIKDLHLLIVDDIEANLISLEYLLLDEFENLNITKANSGLQALEIALKQSIDFVILDIQMPGMDGFEVAKFLKSNKKTADVPILFLTAAFKEDEFLQRGFEVGAIDYLTKPIDNHQFINKLKLYFKIFAQNRALKSLLEEKVKKNEIMRLIVNMSNHLILITNTKDLYVVNQSFLDFFHVNSFEEFQEKYECIFKNVQLNDEFCLELNSMNFNNPLKVFELFYTAVQKLDENYRIVTIPLDNAVHSFFIDIIKRDEFFLLTLTNITSIQENQIKIIEKAFYDNLTGIYNRNKFNEIFYLELKKAQRGALLSYVMFDIDHFKRVNDTYGHLVGDEVLKGIAKAVKEHIRETDCFVRWGGEEFFLILPNTSKEQALILAQKLQKIVREVKHKSVDKPITISFGVCSYQENDSKESILARCDKALYEAKESGRDRVCVA